MCCGDLKYAPKSHNHAQFYTKKQLNILLQDYYTKDEIDAFLADINLSDYYTKTEIDAFLADINLSGYYTKEELYPYFAESYFNARRTGDQLNVTGVGNLAIIINNTTNINVTFDYDPTTGKYTTPLNGFYQFNSSVLLTGLVPGTHTRVQNFILVGSAAYLINDNLLNSNDTSLGMSGSVSVQVASGTDIYPGVIVYGTLQIVDIQGNIGAQYNTHFSGHLVKPAIIESLPPPPP